MTVPPSLPTARPGRPATFGPAEPPRPSGASTTGVALLRCLRTVARTPVLLLSPLMMSLFFLLIYSGQLSEAGASYLGDTDFGTFLLPLILLTGAITGAAATGELLVRDLRSGFLDRLTLLHGSPVPYVVAAAATGVTVVGVQSLAVLGAGTAVGFRAGPGPLMALLGYALAVGLGVGLLGAAVALRTQDNGLVNLVTVVFFGLSFFTGFLAPAERLAGWMAPLASVNPLTPVVEAMRGIVVEDDAVAGGSPWTAVLLLAGLVLVGSAATVWAVRGRRSRR